MTKGLVEDNFSISAQCKSSVISAFIHLSIKSRMMEHYRATFIQHRKWLQLTSVTV